MRSGVEGQGYQLRGKSEVSGGERGLEEGDDGRGYIGRFI
jgi:hypothetical protein